MEQQIDFVLNKRYINIFTGFNPQEYPIKKCKTCSNDSPELSFIDNKFGKISVIPAQCSNCRKKDYTNHLQAVEKEEFIAHIGKKCGGRNNIYMKDNGRIVLLTNMKYLDSQKVVFTHIFDYMSERTTKGLYINGECGVGKTYMLKILNNELVKSFQHVCMIKAVDLALILRKETFGMEYKRVLDEFREIETLIIDDYGTQKNTEWVAETMYSIFDYRYENNKTTFITSNKEVDEHDTRLASRFGDNRWMLKVKLSGDDLRLYETIEHTAV